MRTRHHVRSLHVRGFTLVEAIIVIVLTGILAAAVAVFLRAPIQGYLDVARRAELTDIADTALRRIGRDLRLALPNSIRVMAGNAALEFIPIDAAGRYRASAPGDPLDFNAADTTFEIIGPAITVPSAPAPPSAPRAWVVIYNLGITGADAYEGDSAITHVRRPYAGVLDSAVSTVLITSTNRLPFESPARRFQIVGRPVSYICAGSLLTRYSNYNYGDPPATGTSGVLASNVSSCRFTYQAGVTAQNGLLTLELGITRDSETVNLIQQVHVSNVP